jgi:hypothetical protein
MRRLAYFLSVAVFLLSLGTGKAFAQATATGTIQGTVTDTSGAVIAGAQVVAKSKTTDTARTTTTSNAGTYSFEMLPISTYTITITNTGFTSMTETLEILIGQVATVNAELKPGSASVVVEVTGEAPLMDEAKTSVSQTRFLVGS